MKINRIYIAVIVFILLFSYSASGKNYTYDLGKMGYTPDGNSNFSPIITDIISKIKSETTYSDNIILKFSHGKYIFRSEGTTEKNYYILNHNQSNLRKIAIDLTEFNNLTLDGQGSEFLFEGSIIPIVATKCKNLILRNFSIDFPHPQTTQFEIVKNMGDQGMIYYPAPWTIFDFDKKDSKFLNQGDGWACIPTSATLFNNDTKQVIYNTSDIAINTSYSDSIDSRIIESPHWIDDRLTTGMIVVGNSSLMQAPGIFLNGSTDTRLEDVTIHYAEGMGLIAQDCENITLLRFNVSLRGKSDLRCFTTASDATHFCGCKGKIISTDGLYENMMRDAINVHGTYLMVTSIVNDRKEIHAIYMHDNNCVGKWGEVNDSIYFVSSNTLDVLHKTTITSITFDRDNKEFLITLHESLPSGIEEKSGICIENTTWTAEVEFSRNIVRNNKARGCLFSTQRKIVIKDNLFSHISGCAILISGDCKECYQSGSCKNITISKNHFMDVLTSIGKLTDAIISIHPEIPYLEQKNCYYHSGIVIEDNYFETFDRPIVYALSVNGLTIRKNIIYGDTRYKPFHPNTSTFNFKKVLNYQIEDNSFSGYKFEQSKDINVE